MTAKRRAHLAVLLLGLLGLLGKGARAADCPSLPLPTPPPGSQLGCSVALDIGTGESLALGANLGGSGSVTLCVGIIERECEGPLKPEDGRPGDQFGRSVALNEDWLAVGAPFANGGGKIYVYHHDGGRLTLQRELAAADTAPGDQFGLTLAMSGDTLIVGAPNAAGKGGSLSGAVYVFHLEGEACTQTQILTASDARPFDNFGFSLAIDGATVVVGAPFHDGGAGNSGEAYAFVQSSDGWREQMRLRASDGAADDEFGSSVAVSGSTVAVGARAADAGGLRDSGKVYVYERSGPGWNEVAHFAGEAAGDRFGVAAALSGDRLVIGALLHAGKGAAYLYERQSSGWVQDGEPLSGGAQGDHFGQAVAIDAEDVLVGAYSAEGGKGSASLCPLPPPVHAAELSVTESGLSSVKPGETALYKLTVTNKGPDPATQVRLKTAIPAGLQWVGASLAASLDGPKCTAADDGITCNLPDLAVGPPREVKLEFKALETCIPVATIQGTVFAAEHGPVTSNPVSTAIRRTADLEISTTAPGLVNPGGSIPFGLTVTNLGPDLACGVVVEAGRPSTLVPAAALPDCATTSNHFPCAIGELAAQAPYALSASVTTSREARCGTNLVYAATVSAFPASADPTSRNNSQTSTITFVSGLSITKTGGLARAFPGDGVTYTIRVDNPSGGSVRVEDILPPGLIGAFWCRETGAVPCLCDTPGNLRDQLTGTTATYRVQASVRPGFTGRIFNTTHVEGLATGCSDSVTDTIEVVPLPTVVPTLSATALAILALLLALVALRSFHRLRRRASPGR
jgi:uncharacterized repeat protein (TIGR01451 family)